VLGSRKTAFFKNNFLLPHSAFRIPHALVLTVVFALFSLLSACSHVKPWEHGTLSKPGMQVDPAPMISACDDHIYFSREASKGGRSYGGGGCGCN
jgi:hypothetical protein